MRPELPLELWELIFHFCPLYQQVVISHVSQNYPIMATAYAGAARNGHLKILQFLHQFWEKHKRQRRPVNPIKQNWDESVCAAAARGGHLKVLKWLLKQGAPWTIRNVIWKENELPWQNHLYVNAAYGGFIN